MVSPLSGSVSVNKSNVVIQVYYVKGDPPSEVFVSAYALTIMMAVLASTVVAIGVTYIFLRKKRGA